jgi:hypothetical protein
MNSSIMKLSGPMSMIGWQEREKTTGGYVYSRINYCTSHGIRHCSMGSK